jgi:hypothetical protein
MANMKELPRKHRDALRGRNTAAHAPRIAISGERGIDPITNPGQWHTPLAYFQCAIRDFCIAIRVFVRYIFDEHG